ncbi:basic 7s globulin 2 [Phtheirospermum japonicum]|uniref:Basic 7s globulin 2 n=1 Tax=Phtheirospermum japonicum TaxID=374723 RepID=A0A830CF59_9LAMI|nr:basic 7s globulin 2 [Phtheirospermum japonicum]
MASLSLPAFIIFAFSLFHSSEQTLFSPITKDNYTNFYTLSIYLKTPLQPSKLHLDLGSYLPWYDCSRHYKSSSYKPVDGYSAFCVDDITPRVISNCFNPPGPGCTNNSCGFMPQNPVTQKLGSGDIIKDKFALFETGKPGPGPVSELVFSCTASSSRIYRGLARGSTGVAALGRFKHSIPAQLSRGFSSPPVFAVCLPGSSTAPGVAVFNSPGPYYFSPTRIDISKSLTHTQLILGPVGADTEIYWYYKSPEYYLGLTSLRVNRRVVRLNQTLLAVEDNGRGGTKLSTSTRYTLLQTSIYNALVDTFVKESAALNLTTTIPVEPFSVSPFSVCFEVDKMPTTRLGPAVPTIDLVLDNNNNNNNEKIFWRIYGSNSMVRIQNNGFDGWCLGFIDGGLNPKTSIVIGGHQLEDNLLQFDLERQRLGFTSSLLAYNTKCANFDFKSH